MPFPFAFARLNALQAAVRHSHSSVRENSPYFLPIEKAAVVLDGVKLTTDVGPEVRIQLGTEEAERFYTKPRNIVNGVNKVGLGWSSQCFHTVA